MNTDSLMTIYRELDRYFGDLQWWPAESKDEVAIGAILVQNVSWSNTEKAIKRLKEANLLTFRNILLCSQEQMEAFIVSTRFYKTKAQKLIAFATYFISKWQGDWRLLQQEGLTTARQELLSVWGIGPETADDILLYAAELPSFVIDAYTKRIFTRLGYIDEGVRYEELREWFMRLLPPDVPLYNQFHALIDALGHRICLPQKPQCPSCPLLLYCGYGQDRVTHQA